MVRPVVPLSVALACAAFAAPAMATDPQTLESLEARVRELEREIAALKAAQAQAVPPAVVQGIPTPAPLPAVAAPADEAPEFGFDQKRGVFLHNSVAGGSEFRLRGLLHYDGRHSFDDIALDDTFLLRRAEPTLEGNIGDWLGFRFTGQFAGDSATINDAYLDLKMDPRAALRIGKTKTPLGLERLQSSGSNAQVENGFPSELAPGRDLGVILGGKFDGPKLTYALGVFNGTVDGRDGTTTNPDGDLELVARAFFEPRKGLGFGIATTNGDKHGTGNDFLPRYRTPGQATFFSYRSDVAADGEHLRVSPQAYGYFGRFGLLGEYIVSRQEVARAGALASLDHRAWQLLGSFSLTGEDVGYQGITPDRPFAGGEGGWGAFELTARYGELDIDEDAFPIYANPASAAAGARGWGFGFNWYLTPNFKLVADYVHTRFDVAPDGVQREDEDMLLTRAQFSF